MKHRYSARVVATCEQLHPLFDSSEREQDASTRQDLAISVFSLDVDIFRTEAMQVRAEETASK